MDKLIINATVNNCRNANIMLIRAGFAVDAFAVRNGLLIAEISKYQGIAVSKCNVDTIAQALYEIATMLGNNIISITFAIIGSNCNADDIVTLDDVYNETAPDRVLQDKSVRATMLAQYCAIVQAEDLAETIALDVHFRDCKKQVYNIDFGKYDATTLCNKLAQVGIKSYPIEHMSQLVIA